MYGKRRAKAYQQQALKNEVFTASPHRRIQMLLEGAITRITRAIGHIHRKEIAKKGESIGRAVSIVEYLSSCLDPAGGDLTENLAALYDFVMRSLVQANNDNDVALLKRSSEVLVTIKQGWDGIADQAQPENPANSDEDIRLVSGTI